MNSDLLSYIENKIIPQYRGFDAAHGENHVRSVIQSSIELSSHYKINAAMVYTIAAFHDLGLIEDRETHQLVSGRLLREDVYLSQWFSGDQIETMAQAVEDHRASNSHEPRSLYGKIVAEADRQIEWRSILTRTVQYGFSHYPELSKEGHWQRMVAHLHEKYAEGGYLKLWIPESNNAKELDILRSLIKDENKLRVLFDSIYENLI